jgi:hypothetical protein
VHPESGSAAKHRWSAGDGGAGGHGRADGERFLPIYLMALGGGALTIGMLQAKDNLLSALYSFPCGYLCTRR